MLKNLFRFPINNFARNLTTLSSGQKIIDFKNHQTSLEVTVQNPDDTEKILKFNPHWLRFNCHSRFSKQADTGQRQISLKTIPTDLKIECVEIIEQNMIINWQNETKQSYSIVPLLFLLNNCPTDMDTSTFSSRLKPCRELKFFDYGTFLNSDGTKNDETMREWLMHMAEYGLAVIQNFGVKENQVVNFAENIAPVQKTIYGESFDVKVDKNPINIAYADGPLPFHMDLVYYEAPPGLQFLHCIKFDEEIEGGESILLDAFDVAEEFRKEHPEYFKTLSSVPATFQKLHIKNGKSEVMIHHRPHIHLNHRGEVMSMTWSPANEGPLKNLTDDELLNYYDAYLEFSKKIDQNPNIIEYRLKPGEILTFNNRRILHGRNAFISMNGSRHFQGCYVNTDEFKSELRSLIVKKQLNVDPSTRTNVKNYLDLRNITLEKLTIGNNDYE